MQYRLVIREVKSLQITQLFTCLDAIQHIEVSLLSDIKLITFSSRVFCSTLMLPETESREFRQERGERSPMSRVNYARDVTAPQRR